LHRNMSGFGLCQLVVATGLLVVVAACGTEAKQVPTPLPTEVAGPTVGELADRIASAWTGVSTYRTVSGNVEEAGTPQAGSPAGQEPVEVVAEVVLPDRKRQVSTSNGEVIAEYVVVRGEVFARGPLTEGLPATPVTGDWRVVDPATLDPASQWAEQIGALTAPVQPPYSGLSQDERERVAKPLGSIDVDGQSCNAFQIVDTTQTGERVDVTLAIGANDLPCSIQTHVSGVNYVTTFEFNVPLTISAPVIHVRPFQ
jgi:hypothetical protein